MTLSNFKKQAFAMHNAGVAIDYFFPLVEEYFKGLPISYARANFDFLARVRINKDGKVFKHRDELSYPPDHSAIEIQRANLPGQQVFYGTPPTDCKNIGQCKDVAILETAWEHITDHTITRSYFTVSRWRIHRPLQLIVLPFSPDGRANNYDCLKAHENFIPDLRNQCKGRPDLSYQKMLNGLEYISELFCQKEDKAFCYKITACYFNYIMWECKNRNMSVDGLLYLSANTMKEGLNLALNPALVDSGVIQMDWVGMGAIQRDPSDPKHLFFPQVTDDKGGTLLPDGSFSFPNIW